VISRRSVVPSGPVILWLYVNRVPSTMRNRSSINLLVIKWRYRKPACFDLGKIQRGFVRRF
jgi:hypothetical protein